MQLRSGRSTLRRDSRNVDEFNARRRYQKEQQRIEDSIYCDENENENTGQAIEYADIILNDEKLLEKKISSIFHKTKHLLYLNKFQRLNNHTFTQKVQTVMEIYELFRYNMDYLIHYFTNTKRHDKRFIQMIYDKGIDIRVDMHNHRLKRTRSENELYYKCNDLIHMVTYMAYRYILAPY